ncbi:response regulator [bacterium]|nr:response regulator [bacterium]
MRVRPVRILYAEDDEDDRRLVEDALKESQLPNELRFVEDGEELVECLNGRGKNAGAPRPDLIFLDLWMPKKDGHEALAEIKATPSLRQIPVIVLTTSRAEEDVFRSYDLGASSFIRKTTTFESLVELMRALGRYWFEVVDLPRAPGAGVPAPEATERNERPKATKGEHTTLTATRSLLSDACAGKPDLREIERLVLGVPPRVLLRALEVAHGRVPEVSRGALAFFATQIRPIPADMQATPRHLLELAWSALNSLSPEAKEVVVGAIIEVAAEIALGSDHSCSEERGE